MEDLKLDRLMGLREVCEATGVSRSRIYEGMAAGTFPSNRKIGPKSVRWRLSEVRAWMDSLPQGIGAGRSYS